jgi:hypothetical protein
MRTIVLALETRLCVARVAADPADAGARVEALEGCAPRCLAAAAGRLFCGTFGHGAWASENGGAGWRRLDGGLPADARVSAIATHGGRVLIGTEPSAVWCSDDGGAAWRPLAPLTALPSAPEWSFPPRPDTHHVRALLIDPADPDRVWVAIEAGALVRTEDGGGTWIDRTPDGPRDTHTLRVHPRDGGRLYAAAGDGWFESRDRGVSWERPRDGLAHGYCWSLVAHPVEPELRVVSAAAGPRQAHDADRAEVYIYRRTRMAEWEPCGAGLPPPRGTTAPVLANDPVEPDAFWLASNHGVFRSADAGLTWTALPGPWPAELARQRVKDLLVL